MHIHIYMCVCMFLYMYKYKFENRYMWFRVYGVSSRGCVAESTQARILNRRIPPRLALRPCLDRCGIKVSLISDRAHVYLICVLHLFRPEGCMVWAGSGARQFSSD